MPLKQIRPKPDAYKEQLTGQLCLPELLVDPIRVTNSIDFTLPTFGFNFDNPFSNPTALTEDIEKAKAYIDRIINALTKELEWGRLQMFFASPASLIEAGNYLEPGSQGRIVFKDPAQMSAAASQEARALFAAGFIDGYSNLRVLGTDLGRSRIKGGINGVIAQVSIPWLSGLEGQFEFGSKEVRAEDVLYDLLTSPLTKAVLGTLGIGAPNWIFEFLKSSQLDALPSIRLPVGGMEVSTSTSRFGEWLKSNFGLPSGVIKAANGIASQEVFFGAYSLGFGGPQDTGVKRYGGFVVDSRMHLDGLVENAKFHFEIELFTFGAGTDGATFLIPNFKAMASVTSVTSERLFGTQSLITLTNFDFTLSKDSSGLAMSTSGTLTLMGRSSLSVAGRVDLSDAGFVMDLNLSQAARTTGVKVVSSGIELEGTASLRVNTGSESRFGVPGRSARIKVDGSILMRGGLGNMEIVGYSEWSVAAGEVFVEVSGETTLVNLGRLKVAGSVGVATDGVFGSIAVDLPPGDNSSQWVKLGLLGGRIGSGGIVFDGQVAMEINTTSLARSVPTLRVNAQTYITERVSVLLNPGQLGIQFAGYLKFGSAFEIAGQYFLAARGTEALINLDGHFFLRDQGKTLLSSGISGVLLADARGFAGALQIRESSQTAQPVVNSVGVSLSGAMLLEINTTGEAVEVIDGVKVNLPAGIGLRSSDRKKIGIQDIQVLSVEHPALGEFAEALRLDKVDDYVSATTPVELRDRSFTIEFWAKRDTLGTAQHVIGHGTAATSNGLHIGFRNTNQFTFAFYFDDLNTQAFTDLGWHHWAVTYDNDTRARKIYADGMLIAEDVSIAKYQGSGELTIGRVPWGENFGGTVDEVRIWSEVRDVESIRAGLLRSITGSQKNLLFSATFNAAGGGVGDSSIVLKNGAAILPVTPRFVTNNRGDQNLAIDGQSTTFSYLATDNSIKPKLITLDFGSLQTVNQLRWLKALSDVDGQGSLTDSSILGVYYTRGSGPLEGRDFGLVSGMRLGNQGTEAPNAIGSIAQGLIFGENGSGPMSVSFETVQATGVALLVIRPLSDLQPWTLYPVSEFEAYSEPAVYKESYARILIEGDLTLVEAGAATPSLTGTTELLLSESGIFASIDASLKIPSDASLPQFATRVRGYGNLTGAGFVGQLDFVDRAYQNYQAGDSVGTGLLRIEGYKLPSTETTVEFWFRTEDSSGGLMMIENPATGSYDREIWLDGGRLKARIWSEETITGGNGLGDGRWHHVAHVIGISVGGQRLYVDGQLVASGAKAVSDLTINTAVTIGRAATPTLINPGAPHGVRAQFDDVRVWETALSKTHIETYLNRPVSRLHPMVNKLVADFDFENLVGTTVFSRAGGLLNSRLVNSSVVSRPFLQFPKVTLSGSIGYGLNTTSRSYTSLLGKMVALPAKSAKIYGEGILEASGIPGSVERLEGNFEMVVGAGKIEFSGRGKYSWKVHGNRFVEIESEGAFLASSSGMAGQIRLASGNRMDLGISGTRLEGYFLAEFNTSGFVIERIAGHRVDIEPGFRMLAEASLQLATVAGAEARIAGSLTMSATARGVELATVGKSQVLVGGGLIWSGRIQGIILWTGGTNFSGRISLGDTAIELNGGTQYVNAPFVPPQTEMTTELWFRTLDPQAGLFSVADAGGGATDRGIYLLDGRVATTLWRGPLGPEFVVSPSEVNYADGQWHHVAHVLGSSAGGNKLYVDGKLVGSGVGTSSEFTWGIRTRIGFEIQSRSLSMKGGSIDDVRVWNKAMSQSEVEGIMHCEVSKASPDWDKLVAWYDMESWAGASIPSRSGKGPTATLLDGATVARRTILQLPAVSLSGSLALEFNLGSQIATHTGDLILNIPARSFRVVGQGTMLYRSNLFGEHKLEGGFDFRLDSQGLGFSFGGELGGTYTLSANGVEWLRQQASGSLLMDGSGIAGSLQLSSGRSIRPFADALDLDASFGVEINSKKAVVETIAGQRVDIKPGGRLIATGTLGISNEGGIKGKLSGGFEIHVSGNALELSTASSMHLTAGDQSLIKTRVEGAMRFGGRGQLAGKLQVGDQQFDLQNGQYIQVPFVPPQTNYTAEMWFRTEDPNAGLFSVADDSGAATDRGIFLRDGRVATTLWRGALGAEFVYSPVGISYADGKWHHVAHVLGSAGNQIFVDGRLVASGQGTFSAFDWGTRARIGWENQALSLSLRGAMDDVRVWNVAMTESEVNAAMNGAVARNGINYDKLIAWYDSELVQGNLVADRTGRSGAAILLDGAKVSPKPLIELNGSRLVGSFATSFNTGRQAVDVIGGHRVNLKPGEFFETNGTGSLFLAAGNLGSSVIEGSFLVSVSTQGMLVSADGSMDLDAGGIKVASFSVGGGVAVTSSGMAAALDLTLRDNILPALKFAFDGNVEALRAGLSSRLELDGIDDYVQLESMQVDYSRGFTAEAWVRWDALNSWSRVFDFGNGAGVDNILLGNNGTSSNISLVLVRAGEFQVVTAASAITLGRWIHVAATIDLSGTARIYLNGNEAVREPMSLPGSVTRNLNYVGKSNWPDGYFKGGIDEFRVWNLARTPEEIRASMGQQITGTRPGLVVSMGFEPISNRAFNQVGRNFEGTYENGLAPIILNGTGTLELDGVDDFVRLPEMTVDYSRGFSVETWARLDSLGSWSRILDFGNGAGQDNILFAHSGTSNNLALFVFNSGDYRLLEAPGVIKPGQWQHLAGTIDTNNVGRLYVDGVLVAEGGIGLPASVSRKSNFIGKSNWPDAYYHGGLDHLKVWNSTRTIEEIQASRLNAFSTGNPELVMHYEFDPPLSMVENFAVNAKHGRLINGARTQFEVTEGLLSRFGAHGKFDGVSAYGLSVPEVPLAGESWTTEFWAKRDSLSGTGLLFGLGVPGRNSSLHLGFRGADTFTVGFYENDLVVRVPADLGWHHWAVTFDASTLERRLYRDGQLIGRDVANGAFVGVGGVVLGRAVWGENFNGNLDEFRIWRGARSQVEIQTGMSKNSFGSQSGLIAAWNFNPTVDGVVKDGAGNRRSLQMLFGASVVSGPFASFRLEVNFTPNEWELGGFKLESGPYVRVQGSGKMSVLGLELRGSFKFVAKPTLVTVSGDAQLKFAIGSVTLAEYAVSGGLEIASDGILGSLKATQRVGWDGVGFRLDSDFNLQVNTTGRSGRVGAIDLEAGIYARLAGTGRLQFGSSDLLSLTGRFKISAGEGALTLNAEGNISMFGTSLSGNADLGIYSDGIAGRIALGRSSVIPGLFSISGNYAFEVNTTQRGIFDIAPQTLRVVVSGGAVSAFGTEFSGSLSLGVRNGLLEASITENAPLTVNVFGLQTIQVSGYLRSNGDFSLTGSVHSIFGNRSLIALEGNIVATVNNSGVSFVWTTRIFVADQVVKEAWVVPLTSSSFSTNPGVLLIGERFELRPR